MARLIGNVDATGSLSTSISTPATNASAVSLYLPFDTNTNDNSANSHSVTANGNAAVSASQSQFGGKSLALDGSGDSLSLSHTSTLQMAGSDFTIEAWVYISAHKNFNYIFSYSYPLQLVVDLNGNLEIYVNDTDNSTSYSSVIGSTTLSTGTFHHIAAIRNGSTLQLFVDGSADGSTSISFNLATPTAFTPRIGDWGDGGYSFNGYIDDFRVTKGFALYDQNFVPPSQAVGASLSGANETNTTTSFTSLYLPFDSSVTADGSPINHSITANGGVNISSTQAKFGSYSAAFDGSDDQLTFTYDTGQYFGTGDFTVELFAYINGYSSGYFPMIFLGYPGAFGGTAASFGMGFENSGGKLRSNVGGAYIDHNNVSISTGQWLHIVGCRQNGVYRTFVNGELNGSTANTNNIAAGSGDSSIGAARFGGGSGTFYGANGFIDDVRVLNGLAKYTAPFTPPTSAVTATVSQTRNDLAVLYLPFDDGLEDKARNHPVTAYGNAAISATQAQFGGKSLSLDGTGDYLDIPDNSFHFGSGDFTVECWLYHSRDSQSSQATFLDFRNSSSNGFALTITSNGYLGVYSTAAGNLISASSSTEMSKDAWHHFAYCRSGTTGKIFVDGTELGSATDNANYASTSLRIGARYTGNVQYYVGYIDDILISNIAKYTSAFTAPTAASGGEVLGTTTDTRTFSSVWNLNSPEVTEAFKAGTWPTGPFDSRISLYLPFDVDVQDDSSYSHSVTATGCGVSTAQVKYGAQSLDMASNTANGNVATEYLTIPDHSSFDFGSGDFTVTAWVNLDNSAGNKTSSVVLNKSVSGASSNSSFYFGAGKNGPSLYTSASGSSWNGTQLESSTSITPGNWVHIAWVRDGNVFRIFQDGTQTASTTASITIYTSTRDVDIGRQSTSGSAFKGYIDDLRVIKGHAEYSSNFTPPTGPSGGVI